MKERSGQQEKQDEINKNTQLPNTRLICAGHLHKRVSERTHYRFGPWMGDPGGSLRRYGFALHRMLSGSGGAFVIAYLSNSYLKEN